MIIFNGSSSDDHNLIINSYPSFINPVRNVMETEIPGRNGKLFHDQGNYKNVDLEYGFYIKRTAEIDLRAVASDVFSWLDQTGYKRLESSDDPAHYRLARFKGDASITNWVALTGEGRLVFDCKPQRYLKTGEKALTFAESGRNLRNPTNCNARPAIMIKGTGAATFAIQDYVVKIEDIRGSITIDSERQDAYENGTNRNIDVILDDFPILTPGTNKVVWNGDNITSVTIIPHYWEL